MRLHTAESQSLAPCSPLPAAQHNQFTETMSPVSNRALLFNGSKWIGSLFALPEVVKWSKTNQLASDHQQHVTVDMGVLHNCFDYLLHAKEKQSRCSRCQVMVGECCITYYIWCSWFASLSIRLLSLCQVRLSVCCSWVLPPMTLAFPPGTKRGTATPATMSSTSKQPPCWVESLSRDTRMLARDSSTVRLCTLYCHPAAPRDAAPFVVVC